MVSKQWAWQDQAACKGCPDLDYIKFLNPGQSKAYAPGVKDLRNRYCDHCPVIMQCRTWAQGDFEFIGVAGGIGWTDDVRKAERLNHGK
jgi:Transcription factor WhiB